MVNFQISDNPIHYTTRLQEQLRPFLHLLQCTSVFSICKWWVLRSGLLPQSSSACWTLPASWPSRLWWLCGEGRGKEATITECLLCARLPARRWMHLISFNLSRAIPSLFSWLRELNHIFFFSGETYQHFGIKVHNLCSDYPHGGSNLIISHIVRTTFQCLSRPRVFLPTIPCSMITRLIWLKHTSDLGCCPDQKYPQGPHCAWFIAQ